MSELLRRSNEITHHYSELLALGTLAMASLGISVIATTIVVGEVYKALGHNKDQTTEK